MRAAKQCQTYFFCGPDEAGAAAAASRILELLPDPGERVDLTGAELRRDPVRLGDEARSSSLFGDKRHIYIRASGDEAHDALKNHLEGEGDACPVLVVATSATDKSRTAKLLIKRDDALVAMFWPPDLPAVAANVRQLGDAAGVSINGAVAERIARGAGLDIRLAGSEVTKLALYLDASPESPRPATMEALNEIGAATEEEGFMPVVNTVLSGDTKKLPHEIARMKELSLNPVGLLLAFERRTAQLAALAAKVGPRGDIRSTIEAEKRARRIFWRDERDLDAQLRRWRGKRLDRLVERLMTLHRTLLTNNQTAELMLAQELTAITRFAAQRRG
ncbi:DNA polymerase III subunit delta [Sphingomonadaceae bacterium]|nr:DNA polymerase III subunit delta [Sphingomonadaceae bacterium]